MARLLLVLLLLVLLLVAAPAQAAEGLDGLVLEYEGLLGRRGDPAYETQKALLGRIADLRTPEARARLQALLAQYGRADRRRAALLLAALVRHGSGRDLDEAIRWVEQTSRDPLLLELLHRVLAEARRPAARAWLRTVALKKATPRVKAQIVRALAEQGESVSVLPLIKLLREPDRRVRIETLEALGRLRAGNAIPFVARFLQDEDPHLRRAAARALGRIGDERAVAALREALRDPVARVAEAAAGALGGIGGPDAVPDLMRGLETHRQDDLRLADAFLRALQAISGKDIGADPELWRAWWAAVKDRRPFVKAEPKPGRKTVPGPRYHDLPVLSSRIAFVLDVSRSMGWNDRLPAAKEEILKVLERLPSTTRFNVIMYSDHAWSWKPELTSARSQLVKKAMAFVRGQRPVNGTNAYDALAAAFRDPDVDTIFFLSDGHPSAGVTDPDLILLQVRDWNRYRGVRIHAIALLRGEPPAAFKGLEDGERAQHFMQRLAKQNEGLFKLVR